MTNLKNPLSNKGIAVTRPCDQASIISQYIQQVGGLVIDYPLMQITALKNLSAFKASVANLAQFDWVIFISRNAVLYGMPYLLQQGLPATLQFACMGPTTAQALQAHGINQVLYPQDNYDSEHLLSLSEMQTISDKKILIVRGLGGRELLAETLQARGAIVTYAECYERTCPQKDCKVLENAFNQQELHAIMVTSSESMRYLLSLAEGASWLKKIPLCVSHPRITEFATGYQVSVASNTSDEAMLACLQKVLA